MKIIKAVVSSLVICAVVCIVIFAVIKSIQPQESNSLQTDENGDVLLPETDDPIKIYDKETSISVEGGSFLVKEKKFSIDEKNITVLRVENRTGKPCIITVKPQYMAGGTSFGGQVKRLNSFANGYVNYFIFNPGAAYDTMSYELTEAEFSPDGTPTVFCDGSSVTLDTMKMMRDEDLTDPSAKLRTALRVHIPIFASETAEVYTFDYEILLLDNSGNIYKLPERGTSYSHHSDFGHLVFISDVLWENKNDFEIPEELRGEISAIVSIDELEIFNYDE